MVTDQLNLDERRINVIYISWYLLIIAANKEHTEQKHIMHVSRRLDFLCIKFMIIEFSIIALFITRLYARVGI
jgi:hypothetical protein